MEKKKAEIMCDRTDCKFFTNKWNNKCAALYECYDNPKDCKFFKRKEVKNAEK